MKKTYSKPILKSARLMSEVLLCASRIETTINDDITIQGGNNGGFLSNQESEHDIWGNSGNSIW